MADTIEHETVVTARRDGLVAAVLTRSLVARSVDRAESVAARLSTTTTSVTHPAAYTASQAVVVVAVEVVLVVGGTSAEGRVRYQYDDGSTLLATHVWRVDTTSGTVHRHVDTGLRTAADATAANRVRQVVVEHTAGDPVAVTIVTGHDAP